MATMGLMGIVSHLMPMSDTANSVMLLVGLAVGVDYCLFYLRREREEREAGRDAADRAADRRRDQWPRHHRLRCHRVRGDGGHAVHRARRVRGDGPGLADGRRRRHGRFGHRAARAALAARRAGREGPHPVPAPGQAARRERRPSGRRPADEGSRFWRAVLRVVLARPAISLVVAAGALLAIAAPALGMKTQTAHPGPGVRRLAADRRHVQPGQRRLPRRLRAGRGGRQGAGHQRRRCEGGARRLPCGGGQFGRLARPGRHQGARAAERRLRRTSRWSAAPTRTRRRRAWSCCATRCARTRSARSTASRRRSPVRWRDRTDFNDQLVGAVDPGLRLRGRLRLRPDAAVLPLADDRDHLDRAQPALGGAPPTASWSRSSSTAGARRWWARRASAPSSPGCRCSSS